jgi:hypothetical protein
VHTTTPYDYENGPPYLGARIEQYILHQFFQMLFHLRLQISQDIKMSFLRNYVYTCSTYKDIQCFLRIYNVQELQLISIYRHIQSLDTDPGYHKLISTFGSKDLSKIYPSKFSVTCVQIVIQQGVIGLELSLWRLNSRQLLLPGRPSTLKFSPNPPPQIPTRQP